MKTTDFLAEIIRRHDLKDRYGNPGTNYSLWKHMNSKYGWSHATVSNYFNGKGFPGEEQCLQIAAELNIDPGYVLACVQAERAKNPATRKAWQRAAEQLRIVARSAAACVILSVAVWTSAGISDAYASSGSTNVYYVKWLRRWLRLLARAHTFGRRISPRFWHTLTLEEKNNGSLYASTPGGTDPGRSRGVLRLLPANLHSARADARTAGRHPHGAAVESRTDRRLARLSDYRRIAIAAGRFHTSPQHARGLSLPRAAAGATHPKPAAQDRRTRGATASESTARVFSAAEFAAARAARHRLSVSRSIHAQRANA